MHRAAAAAGGLAALVVGLDGTLDVLGRLAPVLLFLLGATVLAELADEAGLFDVAAREAAHLARGRTPALFALVVLAGTASTVLLSLDSTAVLLTPVVLALCAQLGLDALPFAMATLWLSATPSLLLPVSNLTNLLATGTPALADLGVGGYVARTALPTAVAVALTVLVLGLRYRRRLRGRYPVPPRPAPGDPWLLGAAALAVLSFAALVVAEVEVAVAAPACALALTAVVAVRRPAALRRPLVPWRLAVLVVGLFLVVQAGHEHGLDSALSRLAGTGEAYPDLLRLALVAAAGANLVDNLPAYAALEPVAGGSVDRVLALLVGVDVGPLVLLWGSLATLLWRERCAARGLVVPWRHVAALGLVGAPLLVAAATTALLVPTPW
ncbi:SLC13 family permease [Vallicoccus soli]|uniref:Arsenic transporter n=1 Tax=Vallicoccus soli TaxID=2339232 RepID=A0A3A3ZLB1_9ACTN|nr:SLC13 family permease [Vallicoccus soli]RJK96966.1 arsenic transporter [Vallicoccus soli]